MLDGAGKDYSVFSNSDSWLIELGVLPACFANVLAYFFLQSCEVE